VSGVYHSIMSQPEPPRASVIVLNYNGGRLLEECLRSLLDQEMDGGFEVLVVDNQSSDGSPEVVRERFPEARLVRAGRNLGFAGGNNLGMAEARGRHVVLINNDARARPGWLAALVTAAESDPRVGAVTAKVLFAEPAGVIQNAGSLLLSDGSGAERGYEQPDRGQFDTAEEVFAICGAGVLLRRAMLEDVGGFDPTFFLYYEDTDLSWRMRLRGWKVVYEPAAVIEHVHSASSGEWSPMFVFHVDRNRLFMVLKNAPAGFVMHSFAGFYGRALRNLSGGRPTTAGGDGQAPRTPGPRRAGIHVKVALSFLRWLPVMLGRRWRIRRRRTVPDSEIRRWLFPREQWDAR
jgi:N-acetylglucosaminyl-diphospho-decaprenol L-rhamnosyltransferase